MDIRLFYSDDIPEEMRKEQNENRIVEARIRRQYVTRDAISEIIKEILNSADSQVLTGQKIPWRKCFENNQNKKRFDGLLNFLNIKNKINSPKNYYYYGWVISSDVCLLTNGKLASYKDSKLDFDGIWYEIEINNYTELCESNTLTIFENLLVFATNIGVSDLFVTNIRNKVERKSEINLSCFFD